jgi:hypothetical protein
MEAVPAHETVSASQGHHLGKATSFIRRGDTPTHAFLAAARSFESRDDSPETTDSEAQGDDRDQHQRLEQVTPLA